MGITLAAIERMEKLGLFKAGRMSILDIGSSNLYSANATGIERFLNGHAKAPVADAKAFAERLARGSGYDPVKGGLNESFVGELFEKAGMEYLAFDIADGYRTRILDLNHAALPKELRGYFDLVLNFGTTEHILNQYNSFKVMHDATRVGGYIHHSLPGVGYVDHGYITYTARCFFDIAGYNEYEVVDFWMDGPGGSNDLLQGLRSYSAYFPALTRVLEEIERSPQGAALKAAAVPDIGLNVVFRKVKDKPYWGALESSTSVGQIPKAVTATYAGGSGAPEVLEPVPVVQESISREPISHRIARALEPYPRLRAVARSVYRTLRPLPELVTAPKPETASVPKIVADSEQDRLRAVIARFGARALAGLTDPTSIIAEYSGAVRDATEILQSPAYARLSVDEQVRAIGAIYDTTMSVVLAESIAIADRIAPHFARLLKDGRLSLPQAMRLYDCLYGLYFAGAQDIGEEMRRFDSACVRPFDAYLSNLPAEADAAGARALEECATRICYFVHCAHFEKGNAVSPIMASLARSHAARPNRKIFLYCVQWISQDFVDAFAGSGVVVRQFRQDWKYDQLDAIVDQIAEDGIDAVVTDLNSSIASYVFSRRAAPIQAWIVMAFPYWSLKWLDWTLLPILDHQPYFGIPADRCSSLAIKQEPITLIQECSQQALQKARSGLPSGAFVLALFTRLIKAPAPVLDVLRRVLLEEPKVHVLIVGTGDPRAVYAFAGDERLRNRITFMHGNVDLNVYGRVVDAMLDTFPFHAGNSCREVAIHGKPVLTVRTPEWGSLMSEERDAELIARDVDECVALALRLIRERPFYESRSVKAREVAERATRTADMVSEVESALEKARLHRRPRLTEGGALRSRLDRLIARNVAGKNGGPAFYPGQPDPMARRLAGSAAEMFGKDAPKVAEHAQSLAMAYLAGLYSQSGDAPSRKLTVNPEVRDKLAVIHEANRAMASPLFLATRYLIREMYGRVQIEDPALELGMGFGDTAKAILGERKLSVGTTPIVDEIMGARHHFGNHRSYVAADAAQIPFADETFRSVVMNYTFYHLEDPARSCAEMLRVLAPGGRLFFNFAIRDRIEPTRVLPRLMEELGLHDYAEMARRFVFADYGGSSDTPSKEGCLALIERSGFTGIDTVDYLSPELSRLIWLVRDLEILFQFFICLPTENGSMEVALKRFVETELAALLSHDKAFSGKDGGTFMFVSAHKPGSSSAVLSDEEIRRRMVCPVSHRPLDERTGYLWSESAKLAYPVFRDIPLMIPVYADIWRRQNENLGNDPGTWKPFSY